MLNIKILSVVFVLILFFKSNHSFAFGVKLTTVEFNLLHRTCQLFYASTNAGRRHGFATNFSEDELRKANIQAEKTGGAWHYCAGVALLNRAQQTSHPIKKLGALRQSLEEIDFTARNIKPDNSMYGEVHLNRARALFQLDQTEKSREVLNKLIQTHPRYVPGYIELARQHDKQGKTNQAIDILNKVDPELQRSSADFNYFIGMYYFKTKNYEKAKYHAKAAYAMGYPLPGLRRMLREKGHAI